MEKIDYISKDLRSSEGTDEGARIYVITSVHDGKTEVVLEKTIKKRMPVEEVNEALKMYEDLSGGGGRRVITIEDMLDLSWRRK